MSKPAFDNVVQQKDFGVDAAPFIAFGGGTQIYVTETKRKQISGAKKRTKAAAHKSAHKRARDVFNEDEPVRARGLKDCQVFRIDPASYKHVIDNRKYDQGTMEIKGKSNYIYRFYIKTPNGMTLARMDKVTKSGGVITASEERRYDENTQQLLTLFKRNRVFDEYHRMIGRTIKEYSDETTVTRKKVQEWNYNDKAESVTRTDKYYDDSNQLVSEKIVLTRKDKNDNNQIFVTEKLYNNGALRVLEFINILNDKMKKRVYKTYHDNGALKTTSSERIVNDNYTKITLKEYDKNKQLKSERLTEKRKDSIGKLQKYTTVTNYSQIPGAEKIVSSTERINYAFDENDRLLAVWTKATDVNDRVLYDKTVNIEYHGETTIKHINQKNYKNSELKSTETTRVTYEKDNSSTWEFKSYNAKGKLSSRKLMQKAFDKNGIHHKSIILDYLHDDELLLTELIEIEYGRKPGFIKNYKRSHYIGSDFVESTQLAESKNRELPGRVVFETSTKNKTDKDGNKFMLVTKKTNANLGTKEEFAAQDVVKLLFKNGKFIKKTTYTQAGDKYRSDYVVYTPVYDKNGKCEEGIVREYMVNQRTGRKHLIDKRISQGVADKCMYD